MGDLRVAIAGVGNCASSLLQGIEYYRDAGAGGDGETDSERGVWGLMHLEMGGIRPGDIHVVAAFDIDERKVGRPLHEAAFAEPNCTRVIADVIPASEVRVQMGPVHDGVAEHMGDFPRDKAFRVADETPTDVERVLAESGAEILICYLPVGSQKAVHAYAEACLATGVSLVNCVPVFVVSDPEWGQRFRDAGIPCAGDDIKSQVGATILHRQIVQLFADRGVRVDRTYQLNTGGNTDFLNMLSRSRLASKKISKTEAVTSQIPYEIGADNVHIGPSDYVPWQGDNKVCFLRIEGRGFGGAPIELEARLSVQDSPNSAGIVIDVVRYVKIARERRLSGPLIPISAYTMKHPPQQMRDVDAARAIEGFLDEAPAKGGPNAPAPRTLELEENQMANMKIDEVEGIGPVYREKLRAAGVGDTDALLDKGHSKNGREAIAEATGIPEKTVLKWVNMADLFRISGVGGEFAELLECAGVDTVKELRTRNAANLAQKCAEVNEEKKLTRRVPGEATVGEWIEQAERLDPLVTH